MTKQLNVYGWTTRGTHRAIVATSSYLAAAKAAGIPYTNLRAYCSVTGNVDEMRVALAAPGVVFVRPIDSRDPIDWNPRT